MNQERFLHLVKKMEQQFQSHVDTIIQTFIQKTPPSLQFPHVLLPLPYFYHTKLSATAGWFLLVLPAMCEILLPFPLSSTVNSGWLSRGAHVPGPWLSASSPDPKKEEYGEQINMEASQPFSGFTTKQD